MKHKKRGTISENKALQIVNNVAEEYVDLGQTSFATKAELCETILWLRDNHWKQLRRKDEALDAIYLAAVKARLYVTDDDKPTV